MAANYIVPLLGDQILVKIGDGATPTEAFTHPNLINTSRGITFSTATESDELVDLNNQSAPGQTVRRVRSTDTKIDGAGMMPTTSVLTWTQWCIAGTIKNIKVYCGDTVVTGPFVLTQFQVTGERLKSSTCSITLEQAGAVTVAANT